MQTQLADWIKDSPRGLEADSILRKCVHCGFCLATCPTYTLLGDELDSPRGRIYLMKQMLEGSPVTERTQRHLDRCLTCRACETTCPSGVEYGRLVNIGRALVEERVPRAPGDRLKRWLLKSFIPRRGLFSVAVALGRAFRPLLPASISAKLTARRDVGSWPEARHRRRMLVLQGCVQPSLAPSIDPAAARVLDRLGISLVRVPRGVCCGAVAFHLEYQEEGLDYARANIDAWWPHIQDGAEAIVITASGCGTQVKEYGHLLSHDPAYAAKAARVSALARDISEVVAAERTALASLPKSAAAQKIAFHSPCSLQHGLKLTGVVESILGDAGFTLTPVPDAHLCCGSAGAYSLLQPGIARDLRRNKLTALESGGPQRIATANIGCLSHLDAGSRVPVVHWIELLDARLRT
ncbi:MAG TPA: glycolate oxidase subunit GlcF [Usitatibacter sp.]|jgi:glycolate oxidase iron-sulfur subunit|nr:glycolate oxidase subunit GlcF [Usitatibacter sp.]